MSGRSFRGALHRIVQIAAIVVVILFSTKENPWKRIGGGQHYFSVSSYLPEADPFSTQGAPLSVEDVVNARKSSESFFVPLGFREELETVGSCSGGWCPDKTTSPKIVQIFNKTQQFQLKVSARFKPSKATADRSDAVSSLKDDKKAGIFINDQSFNTNVRELISNLAKDQGVSDEEFMNLAFEQGVEALVTYRWKCPDSSSLGQDGCDVTSEVKSLGAASPLASSMPVVVKPAATASRHRYSFFGVIVHLRGAGGITSDTWVPVLSMLTQIFALVIAGGSVVSFIAFRLLPGASRRRAKVQDIYVEQFHAKIAKIVEVKKAANPALAGLSNSLMHDKLADEVEALCGFALDGRNPDKVLKVLDVVLKASGSIHDASKELGPELGSKEGSRMRLKLLKAGNPTSMKQVVPGDNDSNVSQETV